MTPHPIPASAPVDHAPSRLIVAATVWWPFAALGIKAPFLFPYFRDLGLSDAQIAMLAGLAGVAVLATQQLWGYLADVVVGRRRSLIVMTLGCAACMAGLGFAQGFWLILVLWVLNSVFADSRMPLINALFLRAGQGSPRGFGILRSLGTVSFLCTAPVVGLLVDWDGGPGIRLIFPLLVAVNIAYAITLGMRDERLPLVGAGGRPSFATVQRILLARPAIRMFLLFIVLYQLPHNFSMTMQGVLMRDLGATFTGAMAPLFIGAVIEIPGFIWARDLLRRCPLLVVFLICTIAQVLRWALVWAFPVTAVIYATNLLHLVTFGVMYMSAILFIDEELPAEYRSSGQGLLNICYMTVGAAAGPLVSALVFKVLGLGLVDWYAFAALIVLAALPALWMLRLAVAREHAQGLAPDPAAPEATTP